MDTRQIERRAMDTLKEVNYPTITSEIDVIYVAKQLGFVIGNAILNDGDDGFIVVEEGRAEIMGVKTDKLIGVNSARSLEWKRFIIAHELGHYIMHYRDKNMEGLYAQRYHRRGHGDPENEADFFAANLLMPREAFREKYNEVRKMYTEKKDIVNALAKYFIVTEKMTERRIEELDLSGAE